MSESATQPQRSASTRWWLGGLLAAFAALQTLYVLRLPLVMDEFQFGYMVHQLRELVPYRDYLPYKTVLGYYLLLPGLWICDHAWWGLIAIKLEIVLLTTAGLALIAWRMRRLFGDVPTIVAFALLLPMSTFLERAVELRVDMLAGLLGTLALLVALERRILLSGILTGLAFCVSQKSVYYAAAMGFALLVLPIVRERRIAFRDALRFSVAFGVVCAAYALFWSAVGSPRAVYDSVIAGAGDLALGDYYAIRWRYWSQTLIRNPLFWVAGAAAVGLLLRELRRTEPARALLALYAVPFLALAIWHKQPWPYYFVLVVPVVTVLHAAAAAEWLPRLSRDERRIAFGAVLVLGVFFPLLRLPAVFRRDNTVQRLTVETAARIVDRSSNAFSGADLLYQRPPAVPELQWLDAIRLRQLALLPPPEQIALIRRLDAARVKLVILNYRVTRLPRPFLAYLASSYEPLAGNLLIYSPTIIPGRFRLHFDGRYVVRAKAPVAIDGVQRAPGDVVPLRAGEHAAEGGRLRLRLVVDTPIDPRLRDRVELFQNVYDY